MLSHLYWYCLITNTPSECSASAVLFPRRPAQLKPDLSVLWLHELIGSCSMAVYGQVEQWKVTFFLQHITCYCFLSCPFHIFFLVWLKSLSLGSMVRLLVVCYHCWVLAGVFLDVPLFFLQIRISLFAVCTLPATAEFQSVAVFPMYCWKMHSCDSV